MTMLNKMKRLIYSPRKITLIFVLTALLALGSGWYICYPYFLVWLEGFSFFSTLPDFTSVNLDLGTDLPHYLGAFLLQFFKWPVLGALVQSLLPVLSVFLLIILIRKIFKDADALSWIAFLPLPLLVYFQLGDLTLAVIIKWLLIIAVLTIAVSIVAIWKKVFLALPDFLSHKLFVLAVPILSMGASLYVMTNSSSLCNQHEDVARLEHYAEHQQWDKILQEVSYKDAVRNEYKRKYAFLAMTEKGSLTDFAFLYGLSSSDDFLFYDVQEPFCLAFNVLFYKSLGMTNPAIYHSYQLGVQSLPGLSFDSVRYLADLYIELKDYNLAKKYVDILSHSTCHKRWVKERLPKLQEIKDAEPLYVDDKPKFVMESFLPDMSSMVDRYTDNHKYADYLLCGILAGKDGNTFYNVFQIIAKYLYPDGKSIPRLYQEALLLIASHEPDVLNKYSFDNDVWKSFTDFTDMMSKGRSSQAKRKYSDTYWAYVY